VVSLHLPALRDRSEDIPLLGDHFIRKYAADNKKPVCRITAEAMELLTRYPWPGNVRELENVLERAATLPAQTLFSPKTSPAGYSRRPPKSAKARCPPRCPFPSWKRSTSRKVLEETGGNKKKAADILGIDRRTLYRMATRLGLAIKR